MMCKKILTLELFCFGTGRMFLGRGGDFLSLFSSSPAKMLVIVLNSNNPLQ
jgi:hypothetical protein